MCSERAELVVLDGAYADNLSAHIPWEEKTMKPQIKPFLTTALFALAAISTPALSQETGWYAGLGIGQSKANDACTGIVGPGIACDEKDTSWKIFGGYQLNKNFGFELGYVQLGEATASFAGFGSATIETKGFELLGVGTIPITQQFSLYGKWGFFRWDVDFNDGTGLVGNASDSGTDLTYGFGVQYSFTKNLALRGEWQRYLDVGEPNTTGKSDVDVLGVAIVFKF